MNRSFRLLPLALLLGCTVHAIRVGRQAPALEAVPEDSIAAFSSRLAARIALSGATVGLYFRDLARPDSALIGADMRFHAASTMKVPVMIQVFRDIDARTFGLDDRVTVVNEFRSLADSSPFQLDRKDDSDSSVYAQVGRAMSVRDLLEKMITVSSNLATNNLIQKVGAARVTATMRRLGIDSVSVLRGVEDGAAFRAGMNNTLTASGLGQVMAAIADGRAASAASCGEMLHILLRQHFNEGIPAGLPRGTDVAHKTGELTGHHHDGGIVYLSGRPRYVLIVLTRGLDNRDQSSRLIADLTAIVHEHVVPPPPPRRPFRPTRDAVPPSMRP